MPKVAREMSALDVKRASHPGGSSNTSIAVGGVAGLALQVAPSGAKSWILRTVIGDRRREIGLGGYPHITLSQARDKAREVREGIRKGIDPVEHRKAVRASLTAAQRRGLTFELAVDRYLEAKLAEYKNEKHKKQWRATLDAYAVPKIGGFLVSEIAVSDVQRVLEPIWSSKTVTAARLRGRIEAVLAWAAVAGHRTGDNPARWRGNLDAILPKPGRVANRDNQPALSLLDAPAWFESLSDRSGTSAQALKFLSICACRSGEVRGAKWEEFDIANALWTIPAARMKMRREHRVPLPPAAVAILEQQLPAVSEYVFPALSGGALSDMALSAVMRRMHADELAAGRRGWLDPRNSRPAVPHGLRSTFRDWAAEKTEYPREIAEIALAHHVGSEVERAYRRSDMVERRRGLMQAWSGFLRGSL